MSAKKRKKRLPTEREPRTVSASTRSSDGRSTVLNLPIIVCTLIAIMVVVIGVWAWHSHQVRDFAGDAIQHGRELESRAEDRMSNVVELLDRARQLEAEARALEEAGQFEQAFAPRDEARALYRKTNELSQDASQDREMASQYYLQYRELRPHDPAGPLALAEVAEAAGNLPAAVEWYAAAIQANQEGQTDWPLEQKLRVRRAEHLLDWARAYQFEAERNDSEQFRDSALARLRQAEEESQSVVENGTADSQVLSDAKRIRALALFCRRDMEHRNAVVPEIGVADLELLEQGFDANSTDALLALTLARVYRLTSTSDADQVMQRVVESAEEALRDKTDENAHRTAASARLARFQYRLLYDLPGAKADLQKALELAPDSATAHLSAGSYAIEQSQMLGDEIPGNVLARREKLEQARRHFMTARDLAPGNQMTYLGVSEAYRRLGNVTDAIQACRTGLERVGEGNCELNILLLELLLDSRTLTAEEAGERFQKLDAGIAALRPILSEKARRLREARRDLLQARWRSLVGDYPAAIGLLDRIQIGGGLANIDGKPTAPLSRDELRARLLLAGCHRDWAQQLMGRPGTAAEARSQFRLAADGYEELARDLPHMSELRQSAGRMYSMAQDPGKAGIQFQLAVEADDSIGNRFLLARAQIDQIRLVDPGERRFSDIEENMKILRSRTRDQLVGPPWASKLLSGELEVLKIEATNPSMWREKGLQVYRQLEEEFPNSEDLRSTLLDRYRQLQSDEDAQRVVASREIILALRSARPDDANGPLQTLELLISRESRLWKYYRLSWLIAQARFQPQLRFESFQEATELAANISARWPDWAPGSVSAAILAQTKGDFAVAEQWLQKSHELRPNDFQVLEQLLRLQLRLGMSIKARDLVENARVRFPHADALLRLESRVRRSTGDLDRAIELARNDVLHRPTEWSPRVQLGELLAETGLTAEAEEVFREAVLVASDDPRPLVALLKFYTDAGQKVEALKTVMQLAESGQLTPWQKAALVARGLRVLGDQERAEEYLGQAIRACRAAADKSPSDTLLKMEMVELLLLSRTPELLDVAQQEIEGLLDAQLESVEGKRSLAKILWLRNEANDRRQALEIYEDLVQEEEFGSDEDRYRLGMIHESLGDFAAADRVFDDVVESAMLTADELSDQVERCLRTGQLDKAEELFARLSKMAPWDLRSVLLNVRLLHARGRDREVGNALNEFERKLKTMAGDDPEKTADIHRLLGDTFSSVALHAQAESHYRKLLTYSKEAVVPLSACVASQDRVNEAIELVIGSGKSLVSSTHVAALAGICVTRELNDADWMLAGPLLKVATQEYHDQPALLFQIASAFLVQGSAEEAIQILERAALVAPDDVAILNNLASLLCERPDRAADALRYVDRAIKLANASPTLLDTKGTILLHLDRPAEARALLRQAVSGSALDPRYNFHLAVAHERIGDGNKAKDELQRAIKAGLEQVGVVLTPNEREWLAVLKEKYAL